MKKHANETIKLNRFPLPKHRLLVLEENHHIYAMFSLLAGSMLAMAAGPCVLAFHVGFGLRGEYSHALFLPLKKSTPYSVLPPVVSLPPTGSIFPLPALQTLASHGLGLWRGDFLAKVFPTLPVWLFARGFGV